MGRWTQRFLLLALGISTIGSGLSNFAISYKVLIKNHDFSGYGIVLYASILGAMAASFLAKKMVDGAKNIRALTVFLNMLLAVLYTGAYYVYGIKLVALIIFLSTWAMSLVNGVLFKLIARHFFDAALTRINANISAINYIAFAIAPLASPVIANYFDDLGVLFLVDGASFLIVAMIYFFIFEGILPDHDKKDTNHGVNHGFLVALKEVWAAPEIKIFLLPYLLFRLGFSCLIFNLVLVADSISAGDLYLFSCPVISMFMGRLLASFIMHKKGFSNHLCVFFGGTLSLGVSTSMLFFFRGFAEIVMIEFFMGLALAICLISEVSAFQAHTKKTVLGFTGVLKRGIELIAKSVSVPCLIVVIHFSSAFVGVGLLAALFMMSATLLFFRVGLNMKGAFKNP